MTSQGAPIRPPATRGAHVREIGSNFELVEDRYLGPTTSTLPWEDPADIVYVESGRQALALVETELRGQGHTQIHVPSYLCDSMIAPFHRTGWTLRQLPVDSDLGVEPTDLLSQVTTGVLLHTPYFGRQDSPAMLAALKTLRRRGVVVVVDETHRLFSGPSKVADIRVASLRKLLPVYDGGYATGLSSQLQAGLATPSSNSEVADLREIASIAKARALASGDSNDAHLALFAEAEHATHVRTQPSQISGKSFSLLHRLNMELIRMTRGSNSRLLTQALGQSDRFRIINPPSADLLPSYLVLETDDVTGLQQYMKERRIYCTIHWPPSELLPRTKDWPNCYISLHLDHRYGAPDMLRMAENITTFFTSKPAVNGSNAMKVCDVKDMHIQEV
jgi:hypothetical protein